MSTVVDISVLGVKQSGSMGRNTSGPRPAKKDVLFSYTISDTHQKLFNSHLLIGY